MLLFPDAGFERLPSRGESDRVIRYRVSTTSRCFDGHFDGAPILPGVAEIALVLETCADVEGTRERLVGIRDVRFSRPVQPGDEVDVTILPVDDSAARRFEVRAAGGLAASGLVLFGARDDDA